MNKPLVKKFIKYSVLREK